MDVAPVDPRLGVFRHDDFDDVETKQDVRVIEHPKPREAAARRGQPEAKATPVAVAGAEVGDAIAIELVLGMIARSSGVWPWKPATSPAAAGDAARGLQSARTRRW